MLKIGLVGYSDKKFDRELAEKLTHIGLLDAVNRNQNGYDSDGICLVSGLTNIGIPAIGYSFAEKMGWKTVGIACKKASDYECFDVDEKIIVGDEWGDESKKFIDYIDVLVRIGGGKQSLAEENQAKEKGCEVYSYELPLLKD